MWLYISRGVFLQLKKEGEVGSSTMPHKINPIQFENAEGNLGIANSYFNFLSASLPISRLQRDLSGSTIIRNQGMPMSHSYLAIKQIIAGLKKIEINKTKIEFELDQHWEILSEAIQTMLRKTGMTNAYEKIKELTQGENITKIDYKNMVESLPISTEEKNILLNLTPQKYIGLSIELTNFE